MESIELASGLGALHSAVVLAHEYTHAWLWLHDFPPLPAPLEEGICELGLRVEGGRRVLGEVPFPTIVASCEQAPSSTFSSSCTRPPNRVSSQSPPSCARGYAASRPTCVHPTEVDSDLPQPHWRGEGEIPLHLLLREFS